MKKRNVKQADIVAAFSSANALTVRYLEQLTGQLPDKRRLKEMELLGAFVRGSVKKAIVGMERNIKHMVEAQAHNQAIEVIWGDYRSRREITKLIVAAVDEWLSSHHPTLAEDRLDSMLRSRLRNFLWVNRRAVFNAVRRIEKHAKEFPQTYRESDSSLEHRSQPDTDKSELG